MAPDLSTIHLVPLAVSAALIYVVHAAYRHFIWAPYHQPFGNLPRPPLGGYLMGALKEQNELGIAKAFLGWHEKYGRALWTTDFLYDLRIIVTDPVAVNFIITQPDIFNREHLVRHFFRSIVGEGLLSAEGEQARRMRKMVNPAFAAALIRDNYMPVFYSKIYEFRDLLLQRATTEDNVSSPPAAPIIDITPYLTRLTLDVIGLCGFDYDFDGLAGTSNELADAFDEMFRFAEDMDMLSILGFVFPVFRHLPFRRFRSEKRARKMSQKISKKLFLDKMKAFKEEEASASKEGKRGKDLLSLVIRANMDPDVKPEQRLTDEEVHGQIITFMAAGHETSSSSLAWGFWRLATSPVFQSKLRDECLAVTSDTPTMDELNALPYLNAVLHEMLRLDPVALGATRVALVDTVIPLGTPVQGRDGTMMDSFIAPKGTPIMTDQYSMNVSKTYWGPDASEFNPDRWIDENGQFKNAWKVSLPGVWGGMMTFLGGAKGCPGYRFAVAEMKAVLFVIVRAFEFEMAPGVEIIPKIAIVSKAMVKGEESKGTQMPLIMKPVA